jgi:outer membrane receptor protein involved in Fe transport
MVTRHGIDSPTFYAVNASYNGRNLAATIADNWQITPKLRVDGGIRFEHQNVDATLENGSHGDLDSNPLTMYDANAAYLNGTYSTVHNSSGATSWTLGADYAFQKNLHAFVRVNDGYLLPQFDDFRGGVSTTQRIKQFEVGVKTVTDLYSVYMTGFYNKFTGQPQQQILNGKLVNYLLSSQAYGAEFEAQVRPFQGFQVDLTGDYNHARYRNDPGYSGNVVLRQPEWQFRLTPSYTMPMFDEGFFRVYTTYGYVGERWADVQNQQYLPSYQTLDIGAELALNDKVELDVTGTNVTNELGITEGNTRVLGAGTGAGGVFLGRPLFGATYKASVVVRF